ncbi:GyrI-like domain-containing protein [Colwellia psychrerythraea]|uniref:Transcription activator effector binding protein n=1 Tax=Colwellia psychrerythraea TaxID=28229 RepID=A0A099KPT3_COLPS|nr:GyrI-like domain-containing protein [Colwellia psychrerythraea]KGJ91937.1 transcription activator effector binding protein [Colwellia psychrerythraea]
MDKIDLFKLHKADYIAPKTPQTCYVANAHYLTINGIGGPGEDNFNDAVAALYAVAYTVKMTRKKMALGDYVICKLEARYWSEKQKCLSEVDKSQWNWQLMIRTPATVEVSDIVQAANVLTDKGKTKSVNKVKLIEHEFSHCIQMLHIGPYEEESRTIEQMAAYAKDQQLVSIGEHCEIYISDPRRIPAERLKTILRMPLSNSHGS